MAVGTGNPFYIEPAKIDLKPIALGIGSLMKDSRAESKKLDNSKKLMEAYQSGRPDDIAKLISSNPELGDQLSSMIGFKNKETEKNYAETIRRVASTTDPEKRGEALVDRIDYVIANGGNPVQSVMMLDELSKNPEQFDKSLNMEFARTQGESAWKERKRQMGIGGGGGKFGKKSFAPVTLVSTDGKDKIMVMPTFDPETSSAVLSPLDMPEGYVISKETDEEKRAANVLAKGKEVMSKGAARRAQEKIDDGYAAANAVPELNRAIELLQSGIETGGWDNFALKAKQMFGIEGADEGELSQLMGKAVLKQLKPTFGSAFTQTEGDKLDRLEASFGRNPKTNLRLMKNALKIYRRTAENAIKRARKAGDLDTVSELEDALNFSLSQAEDAVGSQAGATDLTPQEQAELEQLRALKAGQSGR